MSQKLFYLQDSRTYWGNDIVWWAKDSKGYTRHIDEAHVFTEEEANKRHRSRKTDIPWPKDYVDEQSRTIRVLGQSSNPYKV